MKKFLICVTCIVVLCSCSSKKKQAEYWKGWVAMVSYERQLQSEWMKRCEDDAKFIPLFSEYETEVRYSHTGIIDTWHESDLTELGSSMYANIQSDVIKTYCAAVKNRQKNTFDDIKAVINKCVNNRVISEDGRFYYERYAVLPGGYNKEVLSEYNVDWLVKDQKNMDILVKNVSEICGDYKDFYKYIMKSVSVIDIKKAGKQSGAKLYDVTYKISYANTSGYALCRILINKKDSEIELVDHSKNLLDLSY